ncbi:hypothetical protein IT575_00945 [bacterium]|nr:hypothetical protein [bacterium]
MFRPLTLAALLAAFLCLLAAPAFADSHQSQGGDSVDIQYSEELRFGELMDRVYTLMSSEKYFGKHQQVRGMAELLKHSDFFNFSGTTCRYRMDNEKIEFYSAKHYSDLNPAGVAARSLALPDVAPVSANYICPGTYVMYMSMQNVPAVAALTLEQLQAQEALMNEYDMGGGGPVQFFGQSGMPELGELSRIVQQLQTESGAFGVSLSGEVALVVYSLPSVPQMTSDNFDPLNSDLDVALMVGINGSEGINNALGMAGAVGGMTPGNSPGPGWMRYDINQMPGAGVIFNDQILVASLKVDRAIAHIEQAQLQGRMSIEPCQFYMDMDLTNLHRNTIKPGVDSMLAWTLSEKPDLFMPQESAAFLFNLPDENALGHLSMGAYNNGGCHMQGSMSTAVLPYAMYYFSVAACTMAQTEMGGSMDYSGEEMPEMPAEAGAEGN